jgi:tripartite-type tricarboxylate transporter receptor subunit TctC
MRPSLLIVPEASDGRMSTGREEFKLLPWLRKKAVAFGFGLLTLSLCAATTAQSQDAKTFYQGNTIKFVVGSAPGGGYDTFARFLAPHLSKVLGATVVVENVPGAGGLAALNRQYVAKPDGLQIMIVNGVAAAMSQLLDLENVRFDLTKFENLGIVNAEPWVWLVEPKAQHKTPAEILQAKHRLTWGASGFVSGLSDGAAMTCDALDMNCRIVIGYPGSNEVSLALGRGEVDALYVSEVPARNYVGSGLGTVAATVSRQRVRSFPDAPTIFVAVKLTPEQQAKFNFRISIDELGRMLVVPAGVPADRLAYLQNAVKQVVSDPAVIAESERRQLDMEYRDPEQTRKLIDHIFGSLTPAQKEQVKEVATKKFR